MIKDDHWMLQLLMRYSLPLKTSASAVHLALTASHRAPQTLGPCQLLLKLFDYVLKSERVPGEWWSSIIVHWGKGCRAECGSCSWSPCSPSPARFSSRLSWAKMMLQNIGAGYAAWDPLTSLSVSLDSSITSANLSRPEHLPCTWRSYSSRPWG